MDQVLLLEVRQAAGRLPSVGRVVSTCRPVCQPSVCNVKPENFGLASSSGVNQVLRVEVREAARRLYSVYRV